MKSALSFLLSFVLFFSNSLIAQQSITCPSDETTTAALNQCSASVTIDPPEISNTETNAALNFDGTNDHLRINSISGFVGGNAARSFEAWIKTSGTGSIMTVFDYGFNSGSSDRWEVKLDNSGRLFVDINGAVKIWDTNLDDGDWHHIAVVHTGGSLSNTIAYVDATLALVSANSTATPNTNNIATVTVGASFPSLLTNLFEGDIDEVRFWDDARTATEISTNYDDELTGSEANLILYLNFNQGNPCEANFSSTISDLAASPTVNNASPISFNNFSGNPPSPCVSNYSFGAPLGSYTVTNDFTGTDDASGTYPVGETTVVWTYTDVSGSTETCDMTVTVNQNPTPTISCPTDVTVSSAFNGCDASVTLDIPTISDVCGNNPGINFDGVNDYLNVSSISGFVTGSAARTFEGWIRRTDNGDNAIVFEYGSPFSNGGRWVVQINSSGQLELYIEGSTKRWNTSLNDSQWHHIAVVHSGGTTLASTVAYVDGVLAGVLLSSSSTVSTSNISAIGIATSLPGNVDYFEGDMDEIRFWSDARSATEIANNMDVILTGSETDLILYLNFNEGDPCENNSSNNPVTDLASSPTANDASIVGFNNLSGGDCNSNYNFGAPLGSFSFTNDFTNTADASGTYPVGTTTVTWTYTSIYGIELTCETDVTVNQNPSPTISCPSDETTTAPANQCFASITLDLPTITDPCEPNTSLNFDGSNDYVGISNLTGFPTGTSPRTFEAWVRKTDLNSPLVVFDYGSNSGFNPDFAISIFANGRLGLDIGTAGKEWEANITDCEWHHIAIAHTGSTLSSTAAYVDGAAVSVAGISNGTLNTASTTARIGSRITGNQNFEGEIDEVRLWNVFRTAGEVFFDKDESLTGNETGLVMYYNFDQGSACANNTGLTSETDLAGGNNTGTLTNFTNLAGAAPACISNYTYGAPVDGFNFTNDFTCGIDGSGNYPVGNTTVNWNYTNTLGTSLTCATNITVNPGSSPTITCPSNVTVTTSLGDCFENVTLGAVSLTDLCGQNAGLNFDGINDYVDIPDVSGFPSGLFDRTFEAWVKKPDNSSGGVIFEYGSGAGGSADWTVSVLANGNLNLDIGSFDVTWSAGIDDCEWYHIAITGGLANMLSSHLAYVNGEVVSISSVNDGTPNTGLTSGAIGSDINNTSFFEGEIDEIRLWSNVRSQASIQALLDNALTGTESSLVLYYDFQEGVPCSNNLGQTTLNDLAGGDNNGSLTNFSNLVGANPPCVSNYTNGPALDNYSFTNDFGCFDPSGDFPIGITTVTWSYTNLFGQSTSCSTIVTVNQNPAPTMTCPSDITVAAALNDCDADVTVPLPVIDDDCGGFVGLNFDGSGDYIVINSPSNFPTGSNPITFETWFRTTETNPGGTFIQYGTGFNIDDFTVRYFNQSFVLEVDGGFAQFSTSFPVNDGVWRHLAVVYPGGLLSNSEMYIDGVSIAQLSATLITPSFAASQGRIGALLNGSTGFEGDLDEVRLWNVARSQTEINTYKDIFLTGSEPGMELYYTFEQGTPCGNNSPVAFLDDEAGGNNQGVLSTFSNMSGNNPACISNYTLGASLGNFSLTNDFNGTSDASGTYPVGTTTVTWNYTSAAGSTASCTMDVTVSQNPTPTFTCPADITTTAALNDCDASVSVPIPDISDDCGNFVGLNFDGSGDYITINSPNNFPTGSNPATFETWFRPDPSATNGTFISYGNGFNINDFTIRYATNTLVFGVDGGFAGFTLPTINDGDWHHLAVVYPGGLLGSTTAYIDGVALSQTSATNLTPSFGATQGRIGALLNSSTEFEGDLDEVRLWDVARTQSEIVADMNTILTGSESGLELYYDFEQGTPCGDNFPAAFLSDLAGGNNQGVLSTFSNLEGNSPACVSNYTIGATIGNFSLTNDFTGTNDASGNYPVGTTTVTWNYTSIGGATSSCTMDITVNQNPAPTLICPSDATFTTNSGECDIAITMPLPSITDACGGLNVGINLDGTNDYVAVNTITGIPILAADRTYEAWVQLTDPSLSEIIFDFGQNTAGGLGWTIFINSGNLALNPGGGSSKVWDADLSDGEWHHIAVVLDGGTNLTDVDAYIDGVLVTPTINPSVFLNTIPLTQLFIGGNPAQNYLEGNIDEVRVWDVGRSAAEIAASYDQPLTGSESGLIVYLDFEQGTPCSNNVAQTTVTDLAGGNNPGTLTNFSNLAGLNPTPCISNYFVGAPINGFSLTNDFNNTSNANGDYPIGTTTVTWTYTTDNSSATCSYDITVNQDPLPIIFCPSDISVFTGNGDCDRAVTVTQPTITDVCGNNAGLNFDGNNDFITIPSAPNLPEGSSARTFETWFRLGSLSANTTFFSTGVNLGVNDWTIRYNGSSNQLVMETDAGNQIWTASISDADWHHVAISYPGGVNSNAAAYLDGVALPVFFANASVPNTIVSKIRAGMRIDNNLAFNGDMDELRFWDVARSQTEIQNNMNNQFIGSETGLVLYYDFNEGNPCGNNSLITTVADNTPFGNSGNLTNFTLTTFCSSNFTDGAPFTLPTFVNSYNGTDDASDTYPLGTTTVTWTYTNAFGNSASCTMDITVLQNPSPTITCPSSIVEPTDAGVCEAAVTVPMPMINDPCLGNNAGLSFGGPNNQVRISNASGFPSGSSARTFETWINTTSNQYANLISYGANDFDEKWVVQLNSSHTMLHVDIFGLVIDFTIPVAINDGNWHHIAVVHPGGDLANTLAYVDGTSLTLTNPINIPPNTTASGLATIGHPNFGADDGMTLDEVRLWGVAKTQAEIMADMDRELFGNETNLILYFDFNEGIACGINSGITSIPDLAGGDHNGSFFNFSNLGGIPPNQCISNYTDGFPNFTLVNDYNNTDDASDTYPEGTTTVTWTYTSPQGDMSTCTVEITVGDNEDPVAVCQDITVQMDNNTMVTVSPSQVDGGSTDNCGTPNPWSLSQSTFDCTDVGDNTVTLTVQDDVDNESTCMATITIVDNTNPLVTCQDITVQLDGAGAATITGNDVVTGTSDNCAVQIDGVTPNSFDCMDIGSNPVVLTVSDVNGNSSTCSSNVTVEDDTDPTAVCQNITVQLDGMGNASITPGQVDGGSTDNCGSPTPTTVTPNAFDINDLGANTVILTVTDASGNTATCSANVEVQNNNIPNAVCQNITVQLDGAGMASITGADVDGGSSAIGGIASLAVSPDQFDCTDLGANTVVLTVTDNSANTGTCNATVTIEDDTAPTASCQDVTIQLDQNGMGSVGVILADSDAEFSGTQGQDDWRYGSNAAFDTGNFSQLPNFTGFVWNNPGTNLDFPQIDALGGHPQIENLFWAVRRWTSDYSGLVTISGDFYDRDNNCGDGAHVRIFQNNNQIFEYNNIPTVSTTYSFALNVNIGDNIDFVIDPIFDPGCDDTHFTALIQTYGIENGSMDNCGIVSMAVDQEDFTCADIGTNTVILTVTDGSGNSSTCQATVTVEDDTPPTASCQSITIQLDGTGNASISGSDIDGGSTDNCNVASLSANPNTFDCMDTGVNNVVLTVTDDDGNSSTCQATVTVEDDTPPTASCQSINIQLDGTGNISITGNDVDGGSTDNCNVASLSANPNTFDCQNTGDNIVVLTVTDDDGNSSTCQATVTVEDDTAPTAICQSITI
ncbi:MAG: LamG-like jellyroll fold domain-containing protein, partial [Bacteroidota bacterium]